MDILTKSSEILGHTQTLLKNITTPVLILVWCISAYTVLDILKTVFTNQPSQLWSLNIVKGVVDAFFYVTLTETMGRWIRERNVGTVRNVVRNVKVSFDTVKTFICLMNNVEFHKLIYMYMVCISLFIFYLTREVLVHIFIAIVNYLVYVKVSGITEYPAIPGSLTIVDDKYGYINFKKNQYTDLETLIQADWLDGSFEKEKKIEDASLSGFEKRSVSETSLSGFEYKDH